MKNLHFNARITEMGDVANRLVALYKKASDLQSDVFLKTTFTEVEKLGKAITDAIKKDTAVSNLEDADAKRDEAIRVLDKLLKGYEHIPVQDLKTHGEKLSAIFKKYGVKITDENYSSQSNLIDSLLTDFSASGVQASITALSGVTEAIANIRKSQTEFNTLRAEYEKALAQKGSEASASSLRKPLLEMINKKLVPYLVAMNIADADKFKTFVAEASQIIESVNEVVKGRSKKSENKENPATAKRVEDDE